MPDFWIRTLKERKDEDWDLGKLWSELCIRRPKEKNVGYCESHDQALVGDKTLMFRLCDAEMYTGMSKLYPESMVIARGIALHKMIRLITASVSGEGYLNFMGNEFGHPEWIDFPREGNGWSFHYCRRQWSLADNKDLRYGDLNEFDKAMVELLKVERTLTKGPNLLLLNHGDKVICYEKGNLVFVFNFHPSQSYDGYQLPMPKSGSYKIVLSTDDPLFGGHGRVDTKYVYSSLLNHGDKVICYEKGNLVFVFNFHPSQSYDGYQLPMPKSGSYKIVLSTDDPLFGGHGRVDTKYVYSSQIQEDGRLGFKCYLPSRSAIVFKKR